MKIPTWCSKKKKKKINIKHENDYASLVPFLYTYSYAFNGLGVTKPAPRWRHHIKLFRCEFQIKTRYYIIRRDNNIIRGRRFEITEFYIIKLQYYYACS